MNNNDQYGDFTVMDDFVNNLMGSSLSGGKSSVDFPIADPPEKDDDDDDDNDIDTIIDDVDDSNKDNQDDIDGNSDDDDQKDNKDDNQDNDINSDDKADINSDNDDDSDIIDLSDTEPEITAFVQEKLFNKLGWTLTEEDTKQDIDSLVEYMEKIVEANSKPRFANEDIEKLNSFVSQGGKLENYFQVKGELDLDSIDLTNEFNQRTVIKELMTEEGYSQNQIDKKIKRYDESGILEEESLEAKESLEKIRQKKADKLLTEQTKIHDANIKQQQQFYNDVSSTIDKYENIRGIKLNTAKKNELKEALLRVSNDGVTKYQKVFNEDPVKNLIESAFFSLNKDAIFDELVRKAESKAAQNLKKKLESKTKRGKSSVSDLEKHDKQTVDHSILDTCSSVITP